MTAKKKATKKKSSKKKTTQKAEPKEESLKKSDIRDVHKYATLTDAKLAADEELKKLSAQITKLTPAVLDYFQRQGIDQVAVLGRTLYLRRELHTSKSPDVTTEQACEVLERRGLPDYTGLRVNIQGLSAYVRELEESGQDVKEIEAQLEGAFRVIEVFKIGSRKR